MIDRRDTCTGLFRPAVTKVYDLTIRYEGEEIPASEGESLIAVLLRHGRKTGHSEFDGMPRAGFCLMGACHDCSVWTSSGQRLRACIVPVTPGLELLNRSPLETLILRDCESR